MKYQVIKMFRNTTGAVHFIGDFVEIDDPERAIKLRRNGIIGGAIRETATLQAPEVATDVKPVEKAVSQKSIEKRKKK